jgi:hypothetical protein
MLVHVLRQRSRARRFIDQRVDRRAEQRAA